MDPELEQALRDRLLAYAEGRASLRDFDEWFAPHVLTLFARRPEQPVARQAVFGIERLMAEYDDGVWTERQLRAQFRRLATEPTLSEPVRAAG